MSDTQIVIRRATIADAEAIWRVHTSAIRRTCARVYSPQAIELWAGMLRPEKYHPLMTDTIFRVAERARGEVLGFCLFFPRSGELTALYVAPEAERQGVGGALLSDVHRIAASLGHASVHLRATLNAESFYTGHGYVPYARAEHRLTADVSLPCIEMSRALG